MNLSLLEKMTMREILFGIILLKEEAGAFYPAKLEYGLKKCSEIYPRFERLFTMHTDGCQEETNAFDSILFFGEMGFILEPGDLTMPHIRMSEYGKKFVEKELKGNYGEGALDVLKPLADAVWEEANKSRW